ncbi:MAG TPA: ABC transporter ATP-binding protein [Thermotogota bacterium]|nr:ABC transporter ATP-binding protein [Thermotogota bacterium]HPJ89808.1 ABC transporter ATP-binding protein [Thermotogota bacterium]HPR96979.1 ABC transporter ATP-binding protein [Thermotogota bacterium]
MKEKILEVINLKKHYTLKRTKLFVKPGAVKALNGIDFSIYKGETFGLVGESGCGKSTAGHTIIRLLDPTEGKILFKGQDITTLKGKELKEIRSDIQIIFQDTTGALNPKKTIEWILNEPLIAHGIGKAERTKIILENIGLVGLDESYLKRYPHELSGGQRQRIGILSALILRPDFIIADEPVSALDVSVQAQILNLMNDLQDKLGLTYLFISHDLNVVHFFCDRIAVMYLGEIMELADAENLYRKTYHPYTQSLISAIPGENEFMEERILLKGDAPNPLNPPSGCFFHPRCFKKMPVCEKIKPEKIEIEKDHFVCCHLYGKER